MAAAHFVAAYQLASRALEVGLDRALEVGLGQALEVGHAPHQHLVMVVDHVAQHPAMVVDHVAQHPAMVVVHVPHQPQVTAVAHAWEPHQATEVAVLQHLQVAVYQAVPNLATEEEVLCHQLRAKAAANQSRLSLEQVVER